MFSNNTFMKKWQVITLIGLNLACLSIAFLLMRMGKANAKILGEIQIRQNEGYRLAGMQKLKENLLQDISKAATTDVAMKSLLARHGQFILATTNLVIPTNLNSTPIAK
jgi:uncharacterized protein YecA (UPF0149 family)